MLALAANPSKEAVVRMLDQVAANDRSLTLRRNTVWVLTRIDHPTARALVLAVPWRP